MAAQWMGWENVFQVEIDPFCQKVLEKNFPTTKRYGDIKQFDGTKYRGSIDILTGGFPCQPYSTAGKRKGKEDDRHLWPEMLRVIREVQPGYVVGENVRGLTNWSGGLVFDEVQADLETEGYQVLPFLLPACAVNAPHRRERRLHTQGIETPERYIGPFNTWNDRGTWKDFPTQPPICGGNDGLPNRMDRVKSLGNAIVPQVAYEIFKAIEGSNPLNH